jgi:hypothetical protein
MRFLILSTVLVSTLLSSFAFAAEGAKSCGTVSQLFMTADMRFISVALDNTESGKREIHKVERSETASAFLTRAVGETKLGVCLRKTEFERSLVTNLFAR